MPLSFSAKKQNYLKTALLPKAVIFDMDGVIVDSMPYHFLAWYEALRPYGVRVGCFDVYAKEGERWAKSLKDFLKKEGIVPSRALLSEIFAYRQKIFKKYFKRFIFKDAEQILRALKKKGYMLSLVTGTPDYEVKRILYKRLYSIFDNIVAGNNVKKGKPHPEPYLKAARMLRVKPKECVVVENAPYGIESAKRAGMVCIAVSTSLPKEFLGKADFIVDKISEIPGIIRI
ncbi:MAG: HAD family phosphatase [Candidatus Omnitrophica bacterium]|nr:HAD family phosphatase [Candidatus Omnitrophota bacterium]